MVDEYLNKGLVIPTFSCICPTNIIWVSCLFAFVYVISLSFSSIGAVIKQSSWGVIMVSLAVTTGYPARQELETDPLLLLCHTHNKYFESTCYINVCRTQKTPERTVTLHACAILDFDSFLTPSLIMLVSQNITENCLWSLIELNALICLY